MNRVDVCWLPNTTNKFLIVQNNEITLYKLEERRSSNSTSAVNDFNSVSQPTSETSAAVVLTKNTEIAFLKTYDCHPSVEHQNLVAVGQANGRVLLTSPFLSPSNADAWLGLEFTPKHSRSCLSLAWNPKNSSLLAIGLDRYRTDNSVLLWDVTSRPTNFEQVVPPTSSSNAVVVNDHPSLSTGIPDHRRVQSFGEYGPGPPSSVGSTSHHSRPLAEFAHSESAVSMVWLKQNPRVLLCGLSGKYVKLFDMRDSSRPQAILTTKCVYGLTLDPFDDNRLCSFNDNLISLWDLRHVDKPLLMYNDQKPLTKIQWDPVRKNVLSSVYRDATTVHVFHLQQIKPSAEDTEFSLIESYVQPRFDSSDGVCASFAWHPKDENRLLIVGVNGELSDVAVCERFGVDWNSGGNLIAAFPRHFDEFIQLRAAAVDDDDYVAVAASPETCDDISNKMKLRARLGYGTDVARFFRQAVDVCKHDDDLQWLWGWLDRMKAISSEDTETWLYDVKRNGTMSALRTFLDFPVQRCSWWKKLRFPGALSIFRMPFGRGGSTTEYRSIFGLDYTGHTPMTTRFYVSPERDRLLQLCGWGSMLKERSMISDPLIQKLLSDGEVERAAAIALFTLRLKHAIQILTNAATSFESKKHLQLVALSLAGFPGVSDKESYLSSATSGSTAMQTPSLWLELCNSILPTVENPYLKATFLFLASKCSANYTYDGILELVDLPVYDKIAFAAVHLPDSSLNEVLERLYRQCLATCNLLGVIISGFGSDESFQLIENYIDRTGDVQTAALLLISTGCYHLPEIDGTPQSTTPVVDQQQQTQTQTTVSAPTTTTRYAKRVEEIIGVYLNLLNRWCLWHVRAETEYCIAKLDDRVYSRTAPQVYLTCTFCSKSVWSGSGRPRQRMNKLGSCPSCKKPLPRCSLCRFHMGIPLHDEENKFGTWFSWCQNCRHGGHAQHLIEWFQEHEECPVTGCTCKCASLDNSCGNSI